MLLSYLLPKFAFSTYYITMDTVPMSYNVTHVPPQLQINCSAYHLDVRFAYTQDSSKNGLQLLGFRVSHLKTLPLAEVWRLLPAKDMETQRMH